MCLAVLKIKTPKKHVVRFEVLAAANMKMAVVLVAASCSTVEVYRRFRSACCYHYQGERPDYTRRYSPEDSHLHKYDELGVTTAAAAGTAKASLCTEQTSFSSALCRQDAKCFNFFPKSSTSG
jgi:hypothetical protein